MRRLRLVMHLMLTACLLAGQQAWADEPLLIRYPRVDSIDGEHGEYGLALLKLALAKAGGHYRVEQSDTRMQQNRALVELQSDSHRIDIVGTMTSPEREASLLPVRIPLTRGLIGWRIAMLRADRKELFHGVRSVEDLRKFGAGQGEDWPDVQILRQNGIRVETVTVYSTLFNLLNAGLLDWVPRSVNEIWAEAAHHPELAIDPYVAVHYVTADYFFVNKKNTALAEEVRRGLEKALADGSFEQLFQLHYGPLIRQARLDRRLIIELPNSSLTPETPLQRKELWFSPQHVKAHQEALP